MTDIRKLKVSLTKHGAHKIYRLMQSMDLDEVLENTWGKFEDIKIDKAQAKKILSANASDILPPVWEKAKKYGDNNLKHLVYIAILFSHHEIIRVYAENGNLDFTGSIPRSSLFNKAYTNLKNDTVELGFCTRDSGSYYDYDLTPILFNSELGPLASELFELKLIQAGWDRNNSLVDECIANGFHRTLSTDKKTFKEWLIGSVKKTDDPQRLANVVDVESEPVFEFQFSSGHSEKLEGTTGAKNSAKKNRVTLRHNELENLLYTILVDKYGADCVGSEQQTGSVDRTAIDIVVKRKNSNFDFYEIKTSVSIKKCIRDALPQLIEYAYWPSNERAKNLIIVAEAKLTGDAKKYILLLKKKFNLPIQYRQIDVESKKLI